MRDPKMEPKWQDVLERQTTKETVRRRVVGTTRNSLDEVFVHYVNLVGVRSRSMPYVIHLSSWRRWAKNANVLEIGE